MTFDANEVLERRAVISGAGQSDVGRRLFRDPLELTVDACLAAIADAGLTPADIDGISTYPGAGGGPAGFSGGGVTDVHDALRLNLNWFSGGLERPGQLGAVIDGCLAVAAGLATHVLCFRSVFEGSAQGSGGRARRSCRGAATASGCRAPAASCSGCCRMARRRPRRGSRCSRRPTSTGTARRASSSRRSP